MNKKDELWKFCEKWIKEYNPTCPESFYQIDHIIENLPELGDGIFQIIKGVE